MTDLTTVPGHVAISGHCPHCGTLQTERCVGDQFIYDGGDLEFTCMKCLGKFKVNWVGLSLSGDTIH